MLYLNLYTKIINFFEKYVQNLKYLEKILALRGRRGTGALKRATPDTQKSQCHVVTVSQWVWGCDTMTCTFSYFSITLQKSVAYAEHI